MYKHSNELESSTNHNTFDDFAQASELFKVLGDPTRLRILDALSGGEMRVQDIADRLGMTQSAISHQLHTLKDHRVVKSRREGKWVYYSIDDAHVRQLFEQGMEHVGHK
jgi:DNA-binding transcriptional ArsR family regulator